MCTDPALVPGIDRTPDVSRDKDRPPGQASSHPCPVDSRAREPRHPHPTSCVSDLYKGGVRRWLLDRHFSSPTHAHTLLPQSSYIPNSLYLLTNRNDVEATTPPSPPLPLRSYHPASARESHTGNAAERTLRFTVHRPELVPWAYPTLHRRDVGVEDPAGGERDEVLCAGIFLYGCGGGQCGRVGDDEGWVL